MSQLALGLRALVVRLTVFFVMAALLAWVLGGTLFPAPQSVTFPAFEVGDSRYALRVTGSARDAGPVTWSLVRAEPTGPRPVDAGVPGPWLRTWGPVLGADGALIGVERSAGGVTELWVARIARNGSISAQQVTGVDELLSTLRLDSGDAVDSGTMPLGG
jgi:hypothetical protein